ncbi:hypothetical protein QTL97_08930 [Sporosarcina thermotolerans]|uniref:ABC transporter permease n=1 Tax=Sporosarcina thermotolerans TaxID=633404 RepID=A0AAW9A6S9_9BACL|nr:hypothetical protein [Sporosarcina thermotolerans]MDW0117057.1 hypothetical protein [Sporosarcina thermotolerans]WHT47840.1 hypothetical protein QNH10_17380 [Sporosarcina thermotolerans]
MRVLWNEIKKIFTWKTMLLLLLINSLLYFFMIEFDIKYFPNGSEVYSYNIGVGMVEKYGATMDDDEFSDFEKVYEETVEETNRYLQSREDFVAEGLDTVEKFHAYDWWNPSQEARDLRDDVFFGNKTDLFWDLQERERLIEFYNFRKTIPEVLTDNQRDRLIELIAEEKFGVYTEIVIQNFKTFITHVGVAILFSVVLVISPTILKDRSRGILTLQYTSKKGRNLFKTKLLAGYISTFTIITGLLTVYLGLYSLNNTSMFFKVRVNTFIGNESWYDPTFFQFIMLCVAAIYLIGFIFVTLSMSFSNVVPNMVSLIGIQIPFIVGFLIIGLNRLLPNMILIWSPKWLPPLSYGSMIIVSSIIIYCLVKREKKMDVLM